MRGWRRQAPASGDCERGPLIPSDIGDWLGDAPSGATPHPPFGHLLPQGEKGFPACAVANRACGGNVEDSMEIVS